MLDVYEENSLGTYPGLSIATYRILVNHMCQLTGLMGAHIAVWVCLRGYPEGE